MALVGPYLSEAAALAACGGGGSSSSSGGCSGFGNWTAGCDGFAWSANNPTIDATCPDPGPPPFECGPGNMGAGAYYECSTCEWTYTDPP